MDTQVGFQPAQQSQGLQPFNLPFEQLYGHLAQKQKTYDVAEATSNEFLIKIGGITDLLEEDQPLAADRYKKLMQREEELRTSVNGDLANPEYRKGLNRLMVETATDKFWGNAMHNYAVYNEKYLPDMQAYQLKFGQPPSAWNDEFSTDIDGYQGADVSGRLAYKGISAPADLTTEMFEIAKQIVPATWKDFHWDEKLGHFINEGGTILSQNDIADVLEGHTWDNSPGYQQLKKQAAHNGVEFEDLFNSAINTTAKTFSVGNTERSVGPGGGDGTGNKKNNTDENAIVGINVTTAIGSAGFGSYEAMQTNLQSLSTNISELETGELGLSGLVNQLKKDDRFIALGAEVEDYSFAFDEETQTGVPKITVKLDGKSYNISNIDELTKAGAPDKLITLAKNNLLPTLRLQEQYTSMYKNYQAAEDMNTRIMAESGFDAEAKRKFEEKYKTKVDEKFKEIINSSNDIRNIFSGYLPIANVLDQMDQNGGVLAFFQLLSPGPRGVSAAAEVIRRKVPGILDEQVELLKKVKDQAVSEVMANDDPNLYKAYKKYEASWADTYGTNGKWRTQQTSNSFGATPEAIRAASMVANVILSNTVDTNNALESRVVLINPDTDEQYTAKEMKTITADLQKIIESKTIQGELNLSDQAYWRYDDDDGLVFEMTIGTSRVEVQGMVGGETLLGSINAHSAAYLSILGQASASLRRENINGEQGESNLVGYIRVPTPDGNSTPAYFNRLAFKEIGVNGISGALEEFGRGSYKYKDKQGNTRYYPSLPDVVEAMVYDYDSTVKN